MANNSVKALKSSVWYIFANFLMAASSFLITPVFARLLTQEQYGLYNNFTSWQSILLILCTFNVQASLISARYDYENNLDCYIFSAISMSAVSVAVWTIGLNLFSGWSLSFFNMGMPYLDLLMAYNLSQAAVAVFQTEQRFRFKYKTTVVLSVSSTLLSLGLSLFLVIRIEDKLTGRIVGNVLPMILIGMCIYISYFIKGRRIDISSWKYALKICLPYIPHLLSLTVLNSTDRIMITKICGATDTALYSLAYSCGAAITVLLNSINSAYIPWLAERLHENDKKSVRSFSKFYILSFVCVALGVMLISPEILYILGGRRYLAAVYVMPPITMGCICQFLYTMMVNIEQIKRKTVGMAFASVAAATTNYVLNLLLIPRFGYIAAAYTTLAGYLLLLGLHMILVHRLKMSDVYNYRFIIGTILAASVFMISVNVVYSNNIVRYLCLICYALTLALLVFRQKNVIRSFVNALKTEQKKDKE